MQRGDKSDEALQPGSTATPFFTFFWSAASGDLATAEAQFADDVEWDMIPNAQIRNGKKKVIPWLRAAIRFAKRTSRHKQRCHPRMGGLGVLE